MLKRAVILACALGLSACGGSGGGTGAPTGLNYLSGISATTIDPSSMAAALAAISPTDPNNLPASATYNGFYYAIRRADIAAMNPSAFQNGTARVDANFTSGTSTLNLSGPLTNISIPGTVSGNSLDSPNGENEFLGSVAGPNGEVAHGGFFLNQSNAATAVQGSFITER